MAVVPSSGSPSIAPSAAPLPTENVQPPSGAFLGSALGQGMDALASATGKTSDELAAHAQAFQAINNKQAADAASIKATSALDQMGLDYRSNNMGMAAYNNLPDFYNKVETARSSFGEDLSPLAKDEFDSATRRYAANVMSNTAGFAAVQRKDAVVGTSNAKIAQAQAQAIALPDDPIVNAAAAQTIGEETAFQSHPDVLGLTDDQAQEKLRQNMGAVYAGQIKTKIDSGDIPSAQAILDKNKDNMTGPQIESVMGALKVGSNAFQAKGFADAIINGGTFTKPGAPQTSWDSGAKLIQASPESALSTLMGAPVMVTSGARTQAQNEAVGGSPTSEHLDGNAWDFLPPKGQSVQAAALTLQNALHAQGVPFDQIEFDPTNGHVHVGFGPQSRNEIIDQSGKVWSSSAGPGMAAPTTFKPPPISPTEDPDKVIADYDSYITTQAATVFAGNPVQEAQAVSAAHQKVMLIAQQMRASQETTYNKLAQAVVGGNIQDESSLANAYPGAASDIAALPAKYQIGLASDLKRNANDMTPARQLTIQQLEGMKATAGQDPTPFLNANIPGMDLPPAVKTQYMKEQADIRGKVTNANVEDNTVTKALKSTQASAALQALGISKAQSPDQYYQFAGALQSEFETFEGQNKRPPSDKDMDAIVSKVTQQVGGGLFGLGAHPAFQVPEEAAQKIVSYYQRKGLGTPTQQDISRMYRSATRGQ